MGEAKAKEAKALVKEFYESVVTHFALERVADFIAPDCVLRLGSETFPLGVSGMREHLAATKQTYPGYTMEILRQYQDGETVISEFIMTGTHEGAWLGMTPSHRRLQFTGVDIDTVVDGKIVAHGGAVNTFETLWEAGLLRPV